MTNPTPAGELTPTFIDDPHAPEVFAEGAVGFFLNAGNIHISFTALRVDHRSSPLTRSRPRIRYYLPALNYLPLRLRQGKLARS
jgi:hypothetical protein